MQFLKNLSIKRKLILIVLVTTGAALFLASIALITHDFIRFRSETKRALISTANIIGMNSTAALEFGDPGAGKETLSALMENPCIVSAAIYTQEGDLFATYNSPGGKIEKNNGSGKKTTAAKFVAGERIPEKPRPPGTYIENDLMMIYLPITLDNEQIGTIYVSADMNEVYTNLRQNVAIILIIFLACFLVALTLSTALQRLISWPILNLADVANRVSESKDFSIRATKESNDESGILVERFNEMLSQIEERDRELQRAQDELEQRVGERTKELELEIAERKRAEESLKYRFEFEKLISGLSNLFINLSPDQIEEDMNYALGVIGEFEDVDRSYIFQHREGSGILSCTHEWCAEGIEPKTANLKEISPENLPWLYERQMRGEIVYFPGVETLPEEASYEKEAFSRAGIKSMVTVPMVFGHTIIGFLGLESVRDEKVWPEDIIPLLNIVGEIFVNVLEHKRTGTELRESQEMLKLVTENIPQAIFWKDVDSRYMGCNKTFASHAGISSPEEIIGKRDRDLAWRKEEAEFFEEIDKRVIENDKPEYHIITPQLHADGKDAWVDMNKIPLHDDTGGVVGLLGTYEDITERKMMEEELLRAQKLESLGILAGGIAHDFNNLLTAILGNISLAKSYRDSQEKLQKRLSEAERASLRARDLTQQLLTFAKGGVPIKSTTRINELLRESAEFAVRGSNSRCEYAIPEGLWPVEIDEGQISQVINNLVINAKQAMPEGGVVNISAENLNLNEGGYLSGKRYIMISIQDSGVGIHKEYLSKIFDPYFTTKQEGNGLGLATCYSIIKKHDGSVTVESEPGRGTIIKVLLPASSGNGSTDIESLEKHISGYGRILVMDDEELVREVAGEMLSSLGYEVSFAKDGSEAISMYETAKLNGGFYDLVILDLTVPGGIGGKETVLKLIEIDPDVKAIASSGYSHNPVMSDFKMHGFSDFIAKPYKLKELGEVVNRVLRKNSA